METLSFYIMVIAIAALVVLYGRILALAAIVGLFKSAALCRSAVWAAKDAVTDAGGEGR
jgi:hypothetical protein